MMKITNHGWAVLENDTHFSKWIEQTGLIDHGKGHEETWREFLPVGGVALDIGANLGDTAIPMGRLVGPNGKVFAIEPNPVVFECLEHNITHAGVDKQVIPLNIGAGEEEAELPFRMTDNVGASFIPKDEDANVEWKIKVKPLDFLALERLDFVKIDIEGYEMFAIHGLDKTIARCRPIIQMELAIHSKRYGYDKLGIVAEMILRGYVTDIPLQEIVETDQLDVVFTPLPGAPNFRV